MAELTPEIAALGEALAQECYSLIPGDEEALAVAAALAEMGFEIKSRQRWFISRNGPEYTPADVVAGPFTSRDYAIEVRTSLEAGIAESFWIVLDEQCCKTGDSDE